MWPTHASGCFPPQLGQIGVLLISLTVQWVRTLSQPWEPLRGLAGAATLAVLPAVRTENTRHRCTFEAPDSCEAKHLWSHLLNGLWKHTTLERNEGAMFLHSSTAETRHDGNNIWLLLPGEAAASHRQKRERGGGDYGEASCGFQGFKSGQRIRAAAVNKRVWSRGSGPGSLSGLAGCRTTPLADKAQSLITGLWDRPSAAE